MPKILNYTTLNASTIDICNVIRNNASYSYQQSIPVITNNKSLIKVGSILQGTPALANEFINALINRVALVVANTSTFNNPYKDLKKGFIEYGETIEQIFIDLAKAVNYDAEKVNQREYKRTLPLVKTEFHVVNWKVFYPVTIEDEELTLAFTSANGVTDMIAKIVDSIYKGVEYDEFLLFKYLIIKAYNKGFMKKIYCGTGATTKTYAKKFRGMSNKLTFLKNEYNNAGIRNNTPIERQNIFMDTDFNAEFDVDELAVAFNMDKATFMGKLRLIDDFTTFDNERFDEIRAHCDYLEEVTTAELTAMTNVKAVLCDSNLFQVYDRLAKMTEKYASSGLYWNYFYHVWKYVSLSSFFNAVAFVGENETTISSITLKVDSINENGDFKTITFAISSPTTSTDIGLKFNTVETDVENFVGITENGAIIVNPNTTASYLETFVIHASIGNDSYVSTATDLTTIAVGDTVTLAIVE